jgi:two-component system, NtrC family, sensor histidine kinase KinB
MIIKTKLTLGLGFLFVIIFALAVFCSYYVDKMGQESSNILKDNYYSIVYAKNMLSGLDDMKTSVSSTLSNTARNAATSEYYLRLFDAGKSNLENNIRAEGNNITELREKEYVEALRRDYETFLKLSQQMKNVSDNSPIYLSSFLPACEKLRQSINAIYEVNMEAVVRKSQLVKHDASIFVKSMALIGTFCLVTALIYFWYFPLYISTTLSYLSERMQNLLRSSGLAVSIRTNDEAHIMLQAIDLLEDKLSIENKRGLEKEGQVRH